eukprot:9260340-Heterocapsa_arctica.AAC.1
MVIARMPEDRSNMFKNLQQPSNTFQVIYTCMCTPVGPTDTLVRSGSKFRCASDGDSERDPFCCVCCLSTFLWIRQTVLDQMCVASPMGLARALSGHQQKLKQKCR